MFKKINTILIINAGGGFGDAVQFIPLINWLYKYHPKKKIYYYASDLNNFYYEKQLKTLIKPNVKVIKNFPLHYGFRLRHFFYSKKLTKLNGLKYFDLIIDSQSKFRNSLIYKRIPHKYYFSSTLRGFFCKPKNSKIKYKKNIIDKILNYLSYINKKKINLKYEININQTFKKKADQLFKKKNYFGLSLTAGHPTRNKEFNRNEIIKVIKYFNKKYKPVFFIEKKYVKLIKFIKNKIPNAYFPEHEVEKKYQNPEFLIALSNQMKFNISIDNGVAHLLSLSKSKTFCFYPGNAEKFKPQKSNFFAYNCKNYDHMQKLKSKNIINFIESNL